MFACLATFCQHRGIFWLKMFNSNNWLSIHLLNATDCIIGTHDKYSDYQFNPSSASEHRLIKCIPPPKFQKLTTIQKPHPGKIETADHTPIGAVLKSDSGPGPDLSKKYLICPWPTPHLFTKFPENQSTAF